MENANWRKGYLVEINLVSDPNRWGYDPNRYLARVLTGGPFPLLRIEKEGEPHPSFPELKEGDYTIWREVKDREGKEIPLPKLKEKEERKTIAREIFKFSPSELLPRKRKRRKKRR